MKRLIRGSEMVWPRRPATHEIWYTIAEPTVLEIRMTNRKNDKVGKLQKKAPNALKSLNAKLKSAPRVPSPRRDPNRQGRAAVRLRCAAKSNP